MHVHLCVRTVKHAKKKSQKKSQKKTEKNPF